MKKKIYNCIIVMLASLIFGACSSDDEELKTEGYTVTAATEAPVWQIDWQGNESRPDWKAPDIQDYENWSIMKVQIENALKPYTSTDDRLALFVGGECRGVQAPAVIVGSTETNTTTYLLKAWGNEDNGQQIVVTMKYYNARLKQVFARTATLVYRVGDDIGVGTDFIPHFTLGSSKYPVVMIFNATALIAKASITPADGDRMAAFVGNECRGVASAEGPLIVFGRTEGESVTIKYYQSATANIFTFPNVAKTEQQQDQIITFQ